MIRMAGCRNCEQLTSGDCGMHGPVVVSGPLPVSALIIHARRGKFLPEKVSPPVAEAPPQDDEALALIQRLTDALDRRIGEWEPTPDVLFEAEKYIRAASCAPRPLCPIHGAYEYRSTCPSCASRTPAEPEIETWALMLPDGVHDLEAKSLTTGRLLSDADSYQWVKFVDVKALPSADRWQPIDTAPKNGLPIVLGFWNNPSKLGFWSQLKMEWLRLGAPSPTTLEPTHWMPLPLPPSPAEKETSR